LTAADRNSSSLREMAGWTAIGLGLKGLAVMLMRIGRKDPLMGQALHTLDGTYRFENKDGKFYRYLVFENGKVKAPRNWAGPANFTFTLREPAASYLRTRPENILQIVIGNKIAQSGNTYFLFQFGFIMSLMEQYFKRKKVKKSKTDIF